MSRTEFIVAFRGEAVEGGRMDVRELAPALLALGRAIDAANLVTNGDRQPIKVEVRALSVGSFEVFIDVTLTAWEQLLGLLKNPHVEGAKPLLGWLGLLGVSGGLIGLYRFLNGRQPERVERAPNGVTIWDGTRNITVPWEVLRLYQDVAVNAALGQLLDTLKNEAIEEIEFREPGDAVPQQVLKREDRPAFALPSPPEQTVVDDVRTLALSIRSLAFQEGNKWRLFDGQNVITATIEDPEFLRRVDFNQIRFAKGDVLMCQVRTVQKQSAEGLKTEHFVQRVTDHRPAATQIPLPFDEGSIELPQ